MIQSLVRTALELLGADLPDAPGAARLRLAAGPIAPPESFDPAWLVLAPGPFTFNQRVKDQRADQPRPMPVTQRVVLDGPDPRGPYPLDYRPLKGPERATLILGEGTATERRKVLVEGPEFAIDEARCVVTLGEAVAARAPGVLMLEYVAPGIFGVREFRQTLLLDVYAAQAEDAERWASLAAGILLTQADLLLARASADYDARTVKTAHRFEQLELVEGTPGPAASPASLQLTFRVAGRLRVARALPGGAGVIEQIVSPGADPETLVPLKAELIS